MESYQSLWTNAVLKEDILREEALDCYYSIKILIEKHFIKENSSFKAWINISYDSLKRNFRFVKLLEHILIIQEYIASRSHMNKDAFINIHEHISTVSELK